MVGWGLSFLLVAALGAMLALSSYAGAASGIAWTLFAIGLLVSLVFFIGGRPRA